MCLSSVTLMKAHTGCHLYASISHRVKVKQYMFACHACFFFERKKKRYYNCSNEMHENRKGFGFFSRKDRVHTNSSKCTAMKCDNCEADRFRCPCCSKYFCTCTVGTFKCGAEGCGTLVCRSCSYCCAMCRPALIQTSIDCYFKCTK